MNVTKFGHCCMLIEEKGLRIVTDPGSYTTEAHAAFMNIDIVLITHEHADHFHIPSLREILKRNPAAKVICNPSVGALLSGEGIEHLIIGDGQSTEEKGVSIEGIGTTHAIIHTSLPRMENTGYFIANKLWYPGDAFTKIDRKVEVLALPVAGPWMKTQDAIDYALALHPARCFPVHDGILNPALVASGAFDRWYHALLEPQGISFLPLELGREYQLA